MGEWAAASQVKHHLPADKKSQTAFVPTHAALFIITGATLAGALNLGAFFFLVLAQNGIDPYPLLIVVTAGAVAPGAARLPHQALRRHLQRRLCSAQGRSGFGGVLQVGCWPAGR